MKKINSILIALLVISTTAWGIGSALKTLNFETWTTKRTDQTITASPSGTGDFAVTAPLLLDHEATPSNPSAGKVKTYFKSDGNLYKLDENGNESRIGGAGGSRLNLLEDSSFESTTGGGTCTNCTATQETTIKLATPNNESSLKIAFSASTGDYTWTEPTTSEYSQVQMSVMKWIKTDQPGIEVCEVVNSVEFQCTPIPSNNVWTPFLINGTAGTTNYGYAVKATQSITGNVYIDESFSGANMHTVFDIGTASLLGSVRYETTTGCTWVNSATSYSNFSADADCDDNARTVKGQYNVTNGDAGNSDGQLPQIKFSHIPAGTLECRAIGFMYHTTSVTFNSLAFSDGTNRTATNTLYTNNGTDSSTTTIIGKFDYNISQDDVTIQIQTSTTSGSIAIELDSGDEEFEIACYHYPAPQKVVAAKCDGIECENDFSVNIANNGTITVGTKKPNTQWYDSIVRNSTGSITIDYTGLGLTSLPGHSVSNLTGYFNRVTAKSTTSITIETYDSTATLADRDVSVEIFRHNSDHNQFDQRFIPVTDQQTEMFFVNEQSNFWDATGNTNDFDISLGNGNEDNDMFIVEDSGGLTRIRAKQNIDLGVSCMGRGATNTGVTIRDSSANIKAFSETSTADLRQNPSARIKLTKDDYVYCELQNAASRGGGIVVTARPSELKAFIGNLNPKEFVKTPGSNKPVRYVGTATCLVTGSGGSTIDRQGFGDNWLSSITDLSSGTCTITLEDVFSSTPICQLTDHSSSSLGIVWNVFENSATSIDVSCTASSTGTACTGGADFNISCDGVQ